MSSEDQEIGSAVPEGGTGLSRRGLLRGAAGLGVAGVAAGLLIDAAGTASASPAARTVGHEAAAADGEPMVVHVKDAATGDVDLFVGTRLVQFRDPELARRIANAAH